MQAGAGLQHESSIAKRRNGAASACSRDDNAPSTSKRDRETPTTEIEQFFWQQGYRLVAGVDEVGRGCVAGPVVAAACILPVGLAEIRGVRDSKTLSAAQRERLADEIERQALAVAVGAASRREIDRDNIRVASMRAMQRALDRLGDWEHAIYDGRPLPELDAERTTSLVRGDATCLSIACASIVAKVARDALMVRLARRHPEFGWERNAGYGTGEHLDALSRCGPTPHHRRSFAPVRSLLAGECITQPDRSALP